MPYNDNIEEKLKANYEDAKFALLMYQVAGIEGGALLEENERLQSDASFRIPPEIDKAALSAIRHTFAKQHAKRTFHIVGKVLSKVALAVLVLNIAFVTLFSTASAFRADVLNFVYHTYDVATTVTLNGGSASADPSDDTPALSWLPEGYSLYATRDLGPGCFGKEYRNSKNQRIFFDKVSGNTVANFDTENADTVEQTTVLGYDGLYIKKATENGMNQTLVWGDTDHNFLYSIDADNISSVDFQKIIDNLKQTAR